jgi:hypothetical protein
VRVCGFAGVVGGDVSGLDVAGSVHDVEPVAIGGLFRRVSVRQTSSAGIAARLFAVFLVMPAISRLLCAGVDGWPVLAGMAKAAGVGLPAAFGALCALGGYGFIRWGISI